jgi:hypothetical protein
VAEVDLGSQPRIIMGRQTRLLLIHTRKGVVLEQKSKIFFGPTFFLRFSFFSFFLFRNTHLSLLFLNKFKEHEPPWLDCSRNIIFVNEKIDISDKKEYFIIKELIMTPLRKLAIQLNASGVVVFIWKMGDYHTRVRVMKGTKIRRPEWEKIKKQLKGLGFEFKTWAIGWYCDYHKGTWIPLK